MPKCVLMTKEQREQHIVFTVGPQYNTYNSTTAAPVPPQEWIFITTGIHFKIFSVFNELALINRFFFTQPL